jgi:intracellular multiplication protein IcmV
MKHCLLMSILYFIAGLLFLTYTLYMILHLHLGMILGLLVTALMMLFAYREHFWYFQMKTRKLGNTFKDWLSFVLRRGHKNA